MLERTVPPDEEPVTLTEMIEHLREYTSIPQASQDEIAALIASAREWAEHFTGQALLEQQWRLTIDRRLGNPPALSFIPFLPAGTNGYGWYQGNMSDRLIGWPLRRTPIQSILSVLSVDSDGVETVVDPATYRLAEKDSRWPSIAPVPSGSWTGDVFRIVYKAGYTDLELVPSRFKSAIKLHAEAHYDRDERMMEKLLMAAENLIKPERVELSLA